MDKNQIDSPMIQRNSNTLDKDNYILHQTAEDVISEYEGSINNNINLNNNDKNEILSHRNSFQDIISEKISFISNTLKKEKTGMLYCLLAHFLWTTNSIYLKYLTQYFQSKFKNKTFLFSRGLMTIIISYFFGLY